jgi:protease I
VAQELTGKRIAFLVANEGVEQVELTSPWGAVEEAGGQPVLVAPQEGKVQAFEHLDKAGTFEVDMTTEDASGQDFDALVLPGGVANPDRLRVHEPSVAMVRDFLDRGRPVAAICHGPWVIVEAGKAAGRTMTSWPSLRTDIRNAGGTWVDDKARLCTSGPGPLLTSRGPDDLEAFDEALVRMLASARA